MHIDGGANIFAIKNKLLFFTLNLKAQSYTPASGSQALSQGVALPSSNLKVPIRFTPAPLIMCQTIQSQDVLWVPSSITSDLHLQLASPFCIAALLIHKVDHTYFQALFKITLIILTSNFCIHQTFNSGRISNPSSQVLPPSTQALNSFINDLVTSTMTQFAKCVQSNI
jgi:hypothetical protein